MAVALQVAINVLIFISKERVTQRREKGTSGSALTYKELESVTPMVKQTENQ